MAFGVITMLFAPVPALAQPNNGPLSREVVQPLPAAGASDLSTALKRLSSSPNDVTALLSAGSAALKLEDLDAATGFFTRAERIGTAGGRAKAGLAAVQVYQKKPVEALQLFEQAKTGGASLYGRAGDRGLAYDLVGDNVRAQEFYKIALERGPDPIITRRLALSQAIGGDQQASERTLLPMLQRSDLAAYRARAFALASLGKTDDAVAIVEAVMPASLASRISPYLRYMPKLTRAQQAAAANLGHFPEASAMGEDGPRIAEYSKAAEQSTHVAQASDARLVPAGEPLGPVQQQPVSVAEDPPVNLVRAEETPPQDVTSVVVKQVSQGDVLASLIVPEKENGAASPVASQPEVSLATAVEKDVPAEEIGPAFDLASVSGSRSDSLMPTQVVKKIAAGMAAARPETAIQTAAPAAGARVAAPKPVSLAEAFADFGSPLILAGPVSGAVDITAIEVRREVAKKEEIPVKPLHPSRIWVQLATGRNQSALGFDWRRFSRKAEVALKGRSGFLASWGQTNRLVTGPFANSREARALINKLKQVEIGSFTFTSAEGEEVKALPAR